MLRITWKENKNWLAWFAGLVGSLVARTGWPWFTHYTYKLEAYGKLFHFDDRELKTRLNEVQFYGINLPKSLPEVGAVIGGKFEKTTERERISKRKRTPRKRI